MADDDRCYLCDSEASIETVSGSQGQRFDVLCGADCPQYIISRSAIKYFLDHPAHRKGAIDEIKRIAASGKFPVVRVVGIPHELLCTSREDELKETT